MGERNTSLFFLQDIIALIVFVGLVLLVFKLHGILLIAELGFLLLLMLFSFVSVILVYYKIRFGSVLLMLIYGVVLIDLIWMFMKGGIVDRSIFFLTTLLSMVGFLVSVSSIKKKHCVHTEEVKEVEPVVETYSPGKFVASKTSAVYHAPKCDWAKKIKEKKQVWFDSEKDAKKKGFKAHSCLKK